ncbi:AEC family transporter [Wenzhouxiangella sp. AB-CW3]|uniref:AEC family transporter n=1 Tax=Wenzhouxiangella sp. AB-CW3 TaxID=2771012 RepID=UPI00168B1C9F|nr:AEC family transporter [Wenzhouxiangella sp. AB-CW3]QOC23732.1 AEC family transporter [Wenzhouxiangella sp. AB-CW3]
MSAYLIIITLVALGWVLARFRVFPDSAPQVLNQVVIGLCLPALIFLHVPSLEPSLQLLPLVIMPWLLLALTIAVILPLARWMSLSREVTAVLLVLIPLGNTSFLGFPLVSGLIGSHALPYAVVYDQLGSFLIVCTHVLFVLAWYGGGEPPGIRSLATRIVCFPPFIALVGALLLGNHWFPVWLMELAETLADMLLPLVTLAIGLSLRLKLVPEYRKPLLIGLAAKLLVLPLVATGVLLLMGTGGDVARVAVLEAAMPPMITAAALLSGARLAPSLATAMVAWGVMSSAITVPAWHLISGLLFA